MCRKLVVVNELALGNRNLGFEVLSLPKGEILEFTNRQLKDLIKSGKDEVYGLDISGETGELIPDENFFCNNWMVKSHINSLVPRFEGEGLVNLFYIVTGTHKEKGNLVYDVVSSRYERTTFPEEKIKTLLEMGIISAGVKLENGELVAAPLEKPKTREKKGETAP
ncbi:MAG: hypothetical protein NC331_12485 [Lachnospiraceae bacterium]|nr:hypothetical protein [Lachnospiraceae bacterium]MCM1240185.1 hypothetical protein [Lachnospiraceae bacterium]